MNGWYEQRWTKAGYVNIRALPEGGEMLPFPGVPDIAAPAAAAWKPGGSPVVLVAVRYAGAEVDPQRLAEWAADYAARIVEELWNHPEVVR